MSNGLPRHPARFTDVRRIFIFAGALLVALLAIATEVSLSGVERVLLPRGLRLLRAPTHSRATTFKAA